MDVNGQTSDIKVSSHQITGGYCLYDEGGPKIRFGEWQYFLPVKLKKRIWLFVYDLRKKSNSVVKSCHSAYTDVPHCSVGLYQFQFHF